jgi:hypothetical protein
MQRASAGALLRGRLAVKGVDQMPILNSEKFTLARARERSSYYKAKSSEVKLSL